MGDMPQNGPTNGADARAPLDVAIVGGGLIGVITALGLVHRGMRVTIYERGTKFQELGAAVGFPRVARECMKRLEPRILETLGRVTQRNLHEQVRYWDGFHPQTKQAAESEESSLLFEVPERDLAFWACLRSHLLLGMAELLPEGTARFGKRLVDYTDGEAASKVILRFGDGSTAEHDLLIGCDGIHSATRKLLLGPDHPAANPSYTHKKVFRGLAPFDGVVAALGNEKAHDYLSHLGPDAHMLSFPINNGTMGNIFFAIHDPGEWKDPSSMTALSTRDEVSAALESWGPHIREAVLLLPETLTMYGVFDMVDNPAPTYASGRVCIAGDAAHASSPFHGAGVGMGVEDALVLSELLGDVQSLPVAARPRSIPAAFQAYSAVRMERTRWLMQSSRDMGDILEWRYPATGRDSAKIKTEFEKRARKIWDFDVDGMVTDSKREYNGRRRE
ncbi:uncharacterized protein B0H64DRAFT_440856 [Chaetomium fimeti]|uniref:FAD-binding domain-containing protein n=1 Tax=Chaetomium fimeti TaxID=1854472 RepID=A0AAE0HJ46_9PEZI|nr:hypothetical protein B0H64DRAFT_440856 [Chaetomium fimeti]